MGKTFQPDSLHPYIMDTRLKKATGSGGISNIPIASAETLGGIKVPADSGITITGSGNAYAYKPLPYSTTEHKTGRKWLDGRDIYEKTIQYDSPYLNIATNGTTIETSTGVDFALNAQAIDPTYKSSTPIKVSVESRNLKGYAFDAQFTAETVTIEYVKPTTP
jgi:hypothetical protein